MIYTRKKLIQWLKKHRNHNYRHDIVTVLGETYRAFTCKECEQVYIFDQITKEEVNINGS